MEPLDGSRRPVSILMVVDLSLIHIYRNSPQLRRNLEQVLNEIVRTAQQREHPTLKSARRWQTLLMKSLKVPDSRLVGAFRGDPGLEGVQVRVGAHYGVDAVDVAGALGEFETLSLIHI